MCKPYRDTDTNINIIIRGLHVVAAEEVVLVRNTEVVEVAGTQAEKEGSHTDTVEHQSGTQRSLA